MQSAHAACSSMDNIVPNGVVFLFMLFLRFRSCSCVCFTFNPAPCAFRKTGPLHHSCTKTIYFPGEVWLWCHRNYCKMEHGIFLFCAAPSARCRSLPA